MKLHPRHDIVTLAEIDIKKSVCDAIGRHEDLTHAELQGIFLAVAASWNKFAIRDEREADRLEKTGAHGSLELHCHAQRDGECNWVHCPQVRDNEPHATGRHCPIDFLDDEE